MEKATNVKKDKIIRRTAEQTTTNTTTARATETASHETTLPRSNVNLSHMSAKSMVKIATLSRATEPEENYTVSQLSFGTGGNQSTSLPTISFGF